MHNIHLFYNKSIVDLCCGRHGVLLNSKPNHIDLRSVSVNMTTPCPPQHKSIILYCYMTGENPVS